MVSDSVPAVRVRSCEKEIEFFVVLASDERSETEIKGISSLYWKPDSVTKLEEVRVRLSVGSQMVEKSAKLSDVLRPPPQLTESEVMRKLSDDNCALPVDGSARRVRTARRKGFLYDR